MLIEMSEKLPHEWFIAIRQKFNSDFNDLSDINDLLSDELD